MMKKNSNKTHKGGTDWRISPKLTGRAEKDYSKASDKNTMTRVKSATQKEHDRLGKKD